MFITVKDNQICRFDNDFLVNEGLMAVIDNFTTVKVIVVSVGGENFTVVKTVFVCRSPVDTPSIASARPLISHSSGGQAYSRLVRDALTDSQERCVLSLGFPRKRSLGALS